MDSFSAGSIRGLSSHRLKSLTMITLLRFMLVSFMDVLRLIFPMPASESVFCCDGVFCFDAVGPPFDVDILMRRLEIADDVRVFAEFIRINDDLR